MSLLREKEYLWNKILVSPFLLFTQGVIGHGATIVLHFYFLAENSGEIVGLNAQEVDREFNKKPGVFC